MNPGRYFIPNMENFSMMRMNPTLGINQLMRNNFIMPGSSNLMGARNVGLIGRITNGLRSFNWKSLLSGANRTLNVVNQTIPLIRQAGPMVKNVRSMFQLARAFGNETNVNVNVNNNFKNNNKSNNSYNYEKVEKKEVMNNNYPNFFI